MDKQILGQIATELQTCGKALTALAERLAQMDEVSETTATKQPEVAAPTLEEVRTVLAGLSRSGMTAEVRELLQKHGADRLSEVKPAEYAAILKEAESLGN